MKIESEWKLLESIRERIGNRGMEGTEDILVSIGDDCAVFKIDENRCGLLTTDISIENIHFRRGLLPLEDIGYKAMMGNLSDIAAMGGAPKYAVISLGIPDEITEDEILRIYDGLIEAAEGAGAVISGGDISKSSEIVLNIALYGSVAKDRLITRSGANRDDIIYVTGTPGDSKAGLEILLLGDKKSTSAFEGLVQKHARPVARFSLVDEIVNMFNPTSMIDISDGLLSDLRHICGSENLGFEIIEEKLPLSNELIRYTSQEGRDPYGYALSGGEEYELLFTSRKNLAEMMSVTINGVKVTPIGRIIDEGFYINRENRSEKILIEGYDHFKK